MNKTIIAIIDDELPIARYLKKTLEKDEQNFQVYDFTDGNKALEFLHDNSVDVIIIDVMMPVINGFEFAVKLREYENHKTTSLIFYSSITKNEDRMKAFQVPILADGFVYKNDDSIDLLISQLKSLIWKNEAKLAEAKLDTVRELGKSFAHLASQKITVILGYSELIIKSINDNQIDNTKTLKHLENIKQNANDIQKMLQYTQNMEKLEIVEIGAGDKIIKVSE